MLQKTMRATRVAVGVTLLGAGAVLALPLVPGPGLLLVFGGLGVLAGEFHWARRARDRLHDGLRRLSGRTHG
jgi:hypothetical protein